MNELLVRMIFFVFLFVACDGTNDVAAPAPGASARPLVTVTEGPVRASVKVEIAATSAQRQQGLMYRQEMAEDEGMLFLFPTDTNSGFWMKNTYLPLDIAYIDAAGTVLEVRKAKPLDETPLYPKQPYRYTLEVNQGWFERHGVGPGSIVTLPADLPLAQ